MTKAVEDDADEFSGEGYLIHLAEVELAKLDALDRWEGIGPQPEPSRGPIDAVWRAAAKGQLTERELALWCEIIAKRVVAQVIAEADQSVRSDGRKPERAERALRSLGLYDQLDANFDARNHVRLLEQFLPLAKRPAGRVESFDSRITRLMLAAGFYPDLERAKSDGPKNFGGLKSSSDFLKAKKRVKRLRGNKKS